MVCVFRCIVLVNVVGVCWGIGALRDSIWMGSLGAWLALEVSSTSICC